MNEFDRQYVDVHFELPTAGSILWRLPAMRAAQRLAIAYQSGGVAADAGKYEKFRDRTAEMNSVWELLSCGVRSRPGRLIK